MSQPLSREQFIQYYRHILLPEVGESGQQRLLQTQVVIIGLGGLGGHVAQQLAAAGIGHLYLLDDDKVEASNLPRQILFGPLDLGHSKVLVAQRQLRQRNPQLAVTALERRFDADTARQLPQQFPALQHAMNGGNLLVLDCSDNMQTRQAVNRWCVQQQLPLVSAAISEFAGQLLLVHMSQHPQAGCYRCLFNDIEPTATCQNHGVLGPSVAVMASLQAQLCLNYLLAIAPPDPPLLLFDARHMHLREIRRQRDPACPVCHAAPELPSLTQHEEQCLL